MIHTSKNANAYFVEYINKNLPALEKELGQKINLTTFGHDQSNSWLIDGTKHNRIPDVVLTYASEFSVLDTETIDELFSNNSGALGSHFIKKEMKNFIDEKGVFIPICFVPLIMFYNKKNVAKSLLSNSWADLSDSKLNVIFPYEDIPISRVVLANLKNKLGTEFENFKKNITFGNSPIDVIHAVANGQYDMGISNLYFFMMSKMNQEENIEINWPKEGLMPLPQVLAFKKDVNPKLYRFIELLTTGEIQNFLGEQGFWPIIEDTPSYGCSPENEWINSWDNWDGFFKRIQNLEKK